jgi:hypothetical protein
MDAGNLQQGSNSARASPSGSSGAITVDEERGAAFLRDGICAVSLTSAVDKGVATAIPVTSFQVYRDALLKDLGGQPDPLQVMLAEQLAVAHHTQLRLQARVGVSKEADECHMLAQAASQMMAEFRRTAVIFREFQAQVIKPLEASHLPGGGRDMQYPDEPPAAPPPVAQNQGSRTEQESKGGSDDGPDAIVPFKKSASRRRRTAKSA